MTAATIAPAPVLMLTCTRARGCVWAGTRGDGDAAGGNVAGKSGELGIGPRGERLAHPRVKLVLVQPTLHERGLERVDHLLAVGMGRPKAATVFPGCCSFVSRACHHRHLPRTLMQGSVAPVPSGGHARIREACYLVRATWRGRHVEVLMPSPLRLRS